MTNIKYPGALGILTANKIVGVSGSLTANKSIGADGILHKFHPTDFSPVTQAIIDRMIAAGSTPSDKYQNAMDTWIIKMIADGDWAEIEGFYELEMEDEIQCFVNWSNASFDANKIGNPIFTPGWGWISDGSGYLDSNFSPVDGVNYDINTNAVYMYIPDISVIAAVAVPFGVTDAGGVGHITILKHTSGPDFSVIRNFRTSGVLLNHSVNLFPGFISYERVDPTDTRIYHNGTQVGSVNIQTPTAFSGNNKYSILANNDDGTRANFCTNHNVGLLIFAGINANRDNLEAGHAQFLLDIA